jgi:hypothetical protein
VAITGTSIATHAGSYLAATAGGGLSGSAGSVSAGATVAAPGSFGITPAGPSVNFSDGTLNIGGSLELDAGLFGIGLSFNIGINLNTIAAGAEAVGMAFLPAYDGPAGALLQADVDGLSGQPLGDQIALGALLSPSSRLAA